MVGFKLKISFLSCQEMPKKCVCVGGGWLRVNLVIDFGYGLALAKLNNMWLSRKH